jgi:hypothetical protein
MIPPIRICPVPKATPPAMVERVPRVVNALAEMPARTNAIATGSTSRTYPVVTKVR